jgi:hypothetical protein
MGNNEWSTNPRPVSGFVGQRRPDSRIPKGFRGLRIQPHSWAKAGFVDQLEVLETSWLVQKRLSACFPTKAATTLTGDGPQSRSSLVRVGLRIRVQSRSCQGVERPAAVTGLSGGL